VSGELRPAASDRLLLAVLAFMLLLVLMNGYLYFRMSRLGEQTEAFAHRELVFSRIKSRPESLEECLRVVQNQDRLHRTELYKMHEVVQAVTSLLRQSEAALGTLQANLESQRVREWSAPPPGSADSPATDACIADTGCPGAS